MSSSFKKEYRDRPLGYRTPSPPRDAYETFSSREQEPILSELRHKSPRAQHKSDFITNGSSQTFATQNGWITDKEEGVERLKHSSEPVGFRAQNAAATYQNDHSQSALELFATLATSPNLGTGPFLQNFNQTSTPGKLAGEFSARNSHDPNGEFHLQERPTKRSRSEIVESSAYLQVSSRSTMIHDGTLPPDTSMEDAELLLSFAKGAIQPRPLEISLSTPVAAPVTSDVVQEAPSMYPGSPPPEVLIATSSDARGLSTEPVSLPNLDIKQSDEINATQHGTPAPEIETRNSITSFPELQGSNWDSDAMTTDGNDIQPNGLPTEFLLEGPGSTPEPKARVYKGWPKGKPRGPRQVPYAKRGTRRAAKQPPGFINASSSMNSISVDGRTHATSQNDYLGSRSATAGPGDGSFHREQFGGKSEHDRQRSHSTSALGSSSMLGALGFQDIRRGKSVPPIVSGRVPFSTSAVPTGPQSSRHQHQITSCASCNSSKNPSNGVHDTWIACTACQAWFHQFCVGFKTEREARNVDKFFCNKCVPAHGPTTFVRKSSRAHASVDYAGLNEGKIRTSTDVPDHHYIKQFIDGTIQFLPEVFPRMRPELVTSDYFEKSGNFSEPIVIPAWMNPRPSLSATDARTPETGNSQHPCSHISKEAGEWFSGDFEYDCVTDDGQDKLDMVIPQGLTVRRVAELYGPEEKVEVIDVKSQEGEDKRWSMRQWADYYEAKGEKPVRNVISLEVSQSKLGRLIRRPKVVRDLDLQDSVWPEEDTAKGIYPKVQFYCLMSVANCYTDFHIDFGGSSVYYHILNGKKTFFFIPPKKQHLKKYEEWCLSANQSSIFLGDETKECYRVDLSDGDTMLIPSGWIHAVWTPVDTLVIGGNFLTRMHYGMQIQINEIEKSTGVARKFRYPYFQKVLWCAVIRYLERDPLPLSVAQLLLDGQKFERDVPIYHEFDTEEAPDEPNPDTYNARLYSQGEVDGWQDLLRYIFRTVMITLGKVQGVSKTTQEAVLRSMPKGYADYLEIAQTFAMWVAWKRGNEEVPSWAYPDAVITEEESATGEKKMSAAALKRLERQAAHDAFIAASGRRSSARQAPKDQSGNDSPLKAADAVNGGDSGFTVRSSIIGKPKQVNGARLVACESCRQRRRRCKHKEINTVHPDVSQRFGIKQFTQPSALDGSAITIVEPTTSTMKEESPSPVALPSSRRSTMVSVVINTPEVEARPALANEHNAPRVLSRGHKDASAAIAANRNEIAKNTGSANNIGLDDHNRTEETLSFGDNDLSGGAKRLRTKACDECRKSKRRCIHDENGHVDPIKAQESAIPRGSHSSKRSRSDVDTTKNPHKRARRQSEGVGSELIDPKLESGVEYDPRSHLPSPPIGDEFVMDTSEDTAQILYDPTHPPTSIDAEILKLEEDFSPSLSPPPHIDEPGEGLVVEDDKTTGDIHDIASFAATMTTQNEVTDDQHESIPQPLIELADNTTLIHGSVEASPSSRELKSLALEPRTAFETVPKGSDRQSDGTPSLHVQTTSNDSLDASASLPSTPPMSPLTDLGPSSPPHSPSFVFEQDGILNIKAESPPLARPTPRPRKQTERFSDSTFDTKHASANQQMLGLVGDTTAPPSNTFAKPTSGRKSTNSRSVSREIRAASHEVFAMAAGHSNRILNEVEKREAQDIKLARELSEQDFGLRRRSR